MKQQKALDSPPKSDPRDESEAESHNPESTSERDIPRMPRCERRSTQFK